MILLALAAATLMPPAFDGCWVDSADSQVRCLDGSPKGASVKPGDPVSVPMDRGHWRLIGCPVMTSAGDLCEGRAATDKALSISVPFEVVCLDRLKYDLPALPVNLEPGLAYLCVVFTPIDQIGIGHGLRESCAKGVR